MLTRKKKNWAIIERQKRKEENKVPIIEWRPGMCKFFREVILELDRPQLAEMIGVSTQSIYHWEQNPCENPPTQKNADKLVEIFGCKKFELYCSLHPSEVKPYLEDSILTWIIQLQRFQRSNSNTDVALALKISQHLIDYAQVEEAWKKQEAQPEQDSMQKDIELHQAIYNPDIDGLEAETDESITEGTEDG